jgi:4-hydroxybenzoate polyprenyltransferase
MLDVTKPALAKLPLAVDLDGTLIRGDLFSEAMLQLAFRKPWKLPQLALWLMRGRAYAKARLAEQFPPDAATLPYDNRLIAWLREERAHGRTLALATASDRRAAQAVADHVGLFDAVFASDGHTNLKSRRKAEALAAAYPDGFSYAGNEHADLKVWHAATQAVVVNASPILTRQTAKRFQIERTFAPTHGALGGIVKAMRPQQWAKNLLVFLPMLVGQGWSSGPAWAQAFFAFWALSAAASGLYLINDIADIPADRRHPRKRERPFASGKVSPVLGLPIAGLLLITGFMLGAVAGALVPLSVYVTTAALYTFWLKRVTLIDVFVLAALYTIRIVLGGVATGFPASDWLLAFAGFFFLSLALVKRAAEMDAVQTDLVGRGYRAGDSAMLKRIGVSAGMIAALVLALYLQQPANQARYAQPEFLWALPAAVVFWLSRVWLKVERGEMHDDPLMFAFRDRVSWAVAAFAGLAFALAALW